MVDRMGIKYHMYETRGGICQLCMTNPAIDMHEIFNRNLTIGNREARELSFSPEICSLLCRDCHYIAHDRVHRIILFKLNLRLYAGNRPHELNPVTIKVREMNKLGIASPEFPDEMEIFECDCGMITKYPYDGEECKGCQRKI